MRYAGDEFAVTGPGLVIKEELVGVVPNVGAGPVDRDAGTGRRAAAHRISPLTDRADVARLPRTLRSRADGNDEGEHEPAERPEGRAKGSESEGEHALLRSPMAGAGGREVNTYKAATNSRNSARHRSPYPEKQAFTLYVSAGA